MPFSTRIYRIFALFGRLFMLSVLVFALKPLYADEFLLNANDIESLASLAGADLSQSRFFQYIDNKTPQIIAISDFNNLSTFDVDTTLLARTLLREITESKHFILTAAIAGNAFNADPMLDSIRAMRNNEEFSDLIPKGTLKAPKYSISGQISSDSATQGKFHIVTYHIIFSLVNLESGLVEWDYIEHIKKSSKSPPPAQKAQSPHGRICLNPSSTHNQKQACEIAISELWAGSLEELSPSQNTAFYEYALKACELDSSFGCRALGSSYKFYKQDVKKAKTYFEKSCDLNDGGGCYQLSILYEHAQGVKQDINKAQHFAKRSCALGFQAGCANEKLLAQYAEEDLNEYALMYQTHCDADLGIACGNLSFSYYHGANGAHKNHTKARILLEKGCDLGDVNSCYQLGLWELQGLGGATKDAKKALNHIIKACQGDVEANCKAINKLDERVKYIYKCEDNTKNISISACVSVGGIYEHGMSLGLSNVKSDVRAALEYYKKACDGGLDLGCTNYNNLQQKVK